MSVKNNKEQSGIVILGESDGGNHSFKGQSMHQIYKETGEQKA